MSRKFSSVMTRSVIDLRPHNAFLCRRSLLIFRLATAVLILGAGLGVAAQTNFGTVNVGASATMTVTVSIPTVSTLGVINVFTQGAPTLTLLIAVEEHAPPVRPMPLTPPAR